MLLTYNLSSVAAFVLLLIATFTPAAFRFRRPLEMDVARRCLVEWSIVLWIFGRSRFLLRLLLRLPRFLVLSEVLILVAKFAITSD